MDNSIPQSGTMHLMSRPKRSTEWRQQGIQLPEPVFRALRARAEQTPHGVKRIGAVAIAAYLGLPARVQQIMLLWLDAARGEGEHAITPEAAAHVLMSLINTRAADMTSAEYLDRLLTALAPKSPSRPPETATPPKTATPPAKDVSESAGATPGETHYVARILDPQVTLPLSARPSRATRAPSGRGAGGGA